MASVPLENVTKIFDEKIVVIRYEAAHGPVLCLRNHRCQQVRATGDAWAGGS